MHPSALAFKEQLRRLMEIKDLGSLVWCLGVKIEQDLVAGTVSLSQELFVHDVLEKAKLAMIRPSSVPALFGGFDAVFGGDVAAGHLVCSVSVASCDV